MVVLGTTNGNALVVPNTTNAFRGHPIIPILFSVYVPTRYGLIIIESITELSEAW